MNHSWSFLAVLLVNGVVAAQQPPRITLTGVPSVARVGERINAQLRVESSKRVSNPVFDKVDALRIQIGSGGMMREQTFINGVSRSSVSTTFPIFALPVQKGKVEFPALRFVEYCLPSTAKRRAGNSTFPF